MEDEHLSTFCAFTSATPAQAQQYLALTDGNVEQAVELFFNNPDLGAHAQPPSASAPTQPAASNRENPINLADDDDEVEEDDDVQMLGGGGGGLGGGHSVEDDEAMARRLQEEMYGPSDGFGGGGDIDPETGVRAPMARTTETLVGPGGDWRDDPGAMNEAVFEQLAARRGGGASRARAGIFNQREAPSIWANDDPTNPEVHRQVLSRATGGASEASSKSNLLAELFKPPFNLISPLPWSEARDVGKEDEKWILVNVQDPSIFDCQVLNRDIWKNPQIVETVKEHFIFLQFGKDDPRGREYIQYYFANMRDMEDAYPHIAIVDPRTGEQVKTWSGSPAPKASDFLMDLHEFLDRYSLNMMQKNPVQGQRKERRKEVGEMSEEEMLEMALQNSLAANGNDPTPAVRDEDPDALTKVNGGGGGKGKAPAADDTTTADTAERAQNGTPQPAARNEPPSKEQGKKRMETPFSRISSSLPHSEPSSTGPETTRIQFRYSGGRVVRRFNLADPVRRVYEWLKASPLPGTEEEIGEGGKEFEIIALGRNLMEVLEESIEGAGLRNASVMVEFVDGDGDGDGEE